MVVDKSPKFHDETNAVEQYFSCGAVYYVVQGGSSLWMKS